MSPPSPLSNTPIGRPSTTASLLRAPVSQACSGGPAQAVGDGGADPARAAARRAGRRGRARRPPAGAVEALRRRPSASPAAASTSTPAGRPSIRREREHARPARRRRADSAARAATASSVDDLDPGLGGVVRRQRAGRRHGRRCVRRPAVLDLDRMPSGLGVSAADAAEAQDHGPAAGAVDDRRLHADARTGPPSSTRSTSSPRSARTSAAVVGLTRPNRLADGAATPPPNAREQRQRQRLVGHPQPDRVARRRSPRRARARPGAGRA